MWSKYKLKFRIETKRKLMIEAANDHGLCSEITVKHSQELDELLNQYRRFILETKEKQIISIK